MSKFCWMLLGLVYIKLLYKTVQSFCSDVVEQNVNFIYSSACTVLCFKKHVSTIKCFMLETSSFTVTSSSPLSPSSSSISTSSSSSSSSPSVAFSISSTSEVCVSPSYLNASVFFLTTCFLLFIGVRCNILLTIIFTDL